MSQFRNHIVKYIIAAVVLVIAVGFVARLNNITKTQLVTAPVRPLRPVWLLRFFRIIFRPTEPV